MNNIIDNSETKIGKVVDMVEHLKEEMIQIVKTIDLFDIATDCNDIESKQNDIDLILELVNGLYQDIITDKINEDTIIEVKYNPMGCYQYEKVEEKMKYYVLCRRYGVESILKSNGVEQYFDTLEQAQEMAKEMRKLVSSADYFVETLEEIK